MYFWINKGNVKLTDFGLSKLNYKDSVRRSMCGTPQYLAPEIALRNPYNECVDWWSFGIIVFEMLSGKVPFDNKNRHQLMRDIISKDFKLPSRLSKTAKDF